MPSSYSTRTPPPPPPCHMSVTFVSHLTLSEVISPNTKLVANPTIFILSNRGFLLAVQTLPQNFLQILPDCCLQRLPERILQKQPSVPQPQPLSSGELTQDEGMSESVVGGNENRENGRPILPGPPKRQEEVRSSPGEQIQIPVEGRQN